MTSKPVTIPEIRQAGLEALRDRLGPAGMLRFLQQYESGRGDYTQERHAWLDSLSLDQLIESIRKRRRGGP